ncbi:MAG: ribonuclease E/G, partial [Alphaproteobacteria bacterium]|nr:ribonuclease E/G [Alphaproteobacteria bacterium]
MAKKMLIDASHPEEMRMAIMDGQRLEGLETESFNKKQLKGNIYLAKVIRIEPSLQAAFVEFGGNRQGFLPFGEIHPDYYHIPVGDRPEVIDVPESLTKEESSAIDIENASHALDVALDEDSVIDDSVTSNDVEDEVITPSADDDDFDEDSVRKRPNRYRYKIQEVIKRRQIMLVQVVKEERGGKGAALTTFLSLPGRYCVHMPNSGERRGGISRKISDTKNRARIRAILDSIDIPDGMSLIVRTAGSDKNKTELKKDFEYLLRLWSDIREKTLVSIAPELIYAEGDLIKRALRDTFTKDMEHVYIEGDEAYKAAKAFMKTMSPSQAKKVIQYKEKQVPLFQKYHIEDLVDEMFQPSVSLPSGGSIVLAQTEALVAIDVNSGKATRERHIDETALKTNIEAAREIARQLRLRDLAGLIVVDFIDMNDRGHVAQVERVFKESLQGDRARIQLGKISQFGLMEMSRQRLRPSLMESNTRECPHCHGAGFVRSVESMALFVLRQLEGAALANPGANLHVAVPADVDLYLLNQKRQTLVELESKYNLSIIIQRDSKLKNTEHHLTIHHPHGHSKIEKQEVVSLEKISES